MSQSDFPSRAAIVATTTDVFPLDHQIHLERIPFSSDFRVKLGPAGEEPTERFQAKIADITAPEKDSQMNGELLRGSIKLKAEITLCPGGVKYLVGRVTEPNGRFDEGGTGVWVAEERPEPEEPPGRR
jgi:hypothetical protein